MKKIFLAELKRNLRSIPFLFCSLIILVENVYYILCNQYGKQISIYLFDQLQPPAPFLFPQYIYLLISIIPAFHIGSDFAYRTINNKISLGYTKKQIFLCQTLVCAITSLLLLCEDTIVSIIFCLFRHYSVAVIFSGKFITSLGIVMCIFICISSFSTFLSFLFRDRIISVLIIFMLSLSLSYIGNTDVSAIMQEKYSSLYTDTGEPGKQENPLYLEGFSRDLCNLRILLSPYAQNAYSPYLLTESSKQKIDNSFILPHSSTHKEFIIVDLILCNITIYLGIKTFEKTNLK